MLQRCFRVFKEQIGRFVLFAPDEEAPDFEGVERGPFLFREAAFFQFFRSGVEEGEASRFERLPHQVVERAAFRFCRFGRERVGEGSEVERRREFLQLFVRLEFKESEEGVVEERRASGERLGDLGENGRFGEPERDLNGELGEAVFRFFDEIKGLPVLLQAFDQESGVAVFKEAGDVADGEENDPVGGVAVVQGALVHPVDDVLFDDLQKRMLGEFPEAKLEALRLFFGIGESLVDV